MNTTNTETNVETESIFLYIMLAIEFLNAIISLWTSYKLQHLNFIIGHFDCFCIHCDDVNIEVSDSESNTKEKYGTKSR